MLPPPTLLQLSFNGLIGAIYKHPKLFSHIPIQGHKHAAKLNKKQLINLIRTASENGIAPASHKRRDLVRQARRVFGNWPNAVKAAGLKCRQVKISDQHVIDEIKSLSVGGVIPASHKIKHSIKALVYTRFGSWAKAAKIAGLKTQRQVYKSKWTKEILIKYIQQHQKNDPTMAAQRHLSATNAAAVLFGSWKKAKLEAKK